MEKGTGIMKNETGTIKGTGENQRNRDMNYAKQVKSKGNVNKKGTKSTGYGTRKKVAKVGISYSWFLRV